MNKHAPKKHAVHSVELFETQNCRKGEIPHLQININREVVKFTGVVFEPSQAKFAIHAESKRIIEHGQANFSNEKSKSLADLYQIKSDSMNGFTCKPIGTLASEKVQEIHFAGTGNLLCTIDTEGTNKTSLSFWLIHKVVQESNDKMASTIDTYEFKKLGKTEVKERNYTAKWDQNGRFFVIHGRRNTNFDKSAKSIKFFNMFGELIDTMDDVKELGQVLFRPRPADILPPGKIKALKKDYKKKYEKIFKEEEQQDKKVQ